MASLPERLAAVARSIDGRGVGLYSLASAVAGTSGSDAWKNAVERNERLEEPLRREVPPSYLGKVTDNRKSTQVVLFENVSLAVSFVQKEPVAFFSDDFVLEALKSLVGGAAGHSVDRIAQAVLCEAVKRTEEVGQLCALPLLAGNGTPAVLRTSSSAGQLLGSIHNFIQWLGLDAHTWRDWLKAAFEAEIESGGSLRDFAADDGIDRGIQKPVLERLTLPGTRNPTPMTNYAGFCLILRLCAGKSAITNAMLDEATVLLGRVKVGDSRLHAELDRNAESSSTEERAFVMGVPESQAQPRLDLDALLLQAASKPEAQALMDDYWACSFRTKKETLTIEAEATQTEVKAKAAVAEAEARAVQAAAKTKICEEACRRKSLTSGQRLESATHRAGEAEARCREAEAKRRLTELLPQSDTRRRRIAAAEPSASDDRPLYLERPLRGASLQALKGLPPHPDYNAYRAAGIPDAAVPQDARQARAWYKAACRHQVLMRPATDAEARLSLRERGARDVYGQPVRAEFCYPPMRESPHQTH